MGCWLGEEKGGGALPSRLFGHVILVEGVRLRGRKK